MAVRLEGGGALEGAFASKPAPTGECPSTVGVGLLAKRPVNAAPIYSIIPVDIHHRHECLPQQNRPAQDQPIPNATPASEGHIMLIHLLTCLALTSVTLTLFSRFFLDIVNTEEQPS